MSDTEYKLPGSVASLPVLAGSVRVEQLRGETDLPTARPDHPVSAIASAPEMDLMPESIERKLIEGKIIAAISKVYDPEIPVNVYELGLIYGIDIYQDRSVRVRMTLTAPGCPVAGSLPGEVEKQVETVDEVKEAEVILVWEPAWDKSRMSEAAMLQLGF